MFEKTKLINDLINFNIKPILVGGLVRDKFINKNLESKDIDLELYTNKQYDEIVEDLNKLGYECKIVGKQFGVIKLTLDNGDEIDLSLPRKEKSIGNKHTDFEIISDGTMSYENAFKRRDFTINSIGYCFVENKIIDIYNGVNDLNNKLIKHINNKTFVEDPLRVFRAIQFAARFEFDIHSDTKDLITNMLKNGLLDHLPKERIFIEFDKLLTKSKKPSIGFELMKELGILEKYFSELNDLINVPQEPKWHPEGDVWIHTMMVIDEMAKLECEKEKKLLYMLSCLCHDLGKPEYTKTLEDGRITSQGHEAGGIEPTLSFLNKLTNDIKLIEQVSKLVELHLQPTLLHVANSSNSAIKRLNNKLLIVDLNIKDLAIINKADSLGRTTEQALNKETPQYEWLLNKLETINLSGQKKETIINGKDLLNLGFKQGPEFREILDYIYDYQIDTEIIDKDLLIKEIKNKYLINELSI